MHYYGKNQTGGTSVEYTGKEQREKIVKDTDNDRVEMKTDVVGNVMLGQTC